MKRLERVAVLLTALTKSVGGEDPSGHCVTGPLACPSGNESIDAHPDVLDIAVPVIDVSALMSPASQSRARWDEAAEAVARACEEWGFFQVT